jgi:hypothetical protein
MLHAMRRLLPLPGLFLLLLLSRAAQAQNSDLGLLVGVYTPRGEVQVSPSIYIHGSTGASLQANYAWQFLQRAVDLYAELPLVLSLQTTGTVTGTSVTGSTGALFFTPGVRVKVSPESRVSFYGALGGGLASFSLPVTVTSTSITGGGRTTTAALGFGGGIDFRLTRLLSLRFDARDFVTRAGLGSTAGRNHGVYSFGIAFHF